MSQSQNINKLSHLKGLNFKLVSKHMNRLDKGFEFQDRLINKLSPNIHESDSYKPLLAKYLYNKVVQCMLKKYIDMSDKIFNN